MDSYQYSNINMRFYADGQKKTVYAGEVGTEKTEENFKAAFLGYDYKMPQDFYKIIDHFRAIIIDYGSALLDELCKIPSDEIVFKAEYYKLLKQRKGSIIEISKKNRRYCRMSNSYKRLFRQLKNCEESQ